MPIVARKALDRFWEKVSPEPMSGCWLWVGGLNREGYGRFVLPGRGAILAHRFSYEAHRGEIGEQLVLDHRCSVPSCVNPVHLEAVPQSENWRRGRSWNRIASREQRCRRGHPATPENVHVRSNGWRYCRVCARTAEKERRDA